MSADRGAERWEERLRAVRRVGWALGLMLLLALAFVVWFALDAPDTRVAGAVRVADGVARTGGDAPPV